MSAYLTKRYKKCNQKGNLHLGTKQGIFTQGKQDKNVEFLPGVNARQAK